LIDQIILGILSVSTLITVLRLVLVQIDIVPKDRKLSFLVYGNSVDLNRKILSDIGFPIENTRNRISKFNIPKDSEIFDKILCVCINSIYKTENRNYYGNDTQVNTQYYVNTMEAVHDKGNLEDMVNGILDLCGRFCKRSPDFIITPKSGNPILAYGITKQDPSKFTILIKSPRDSSRLTGIEMEAMHINNEGINRLLEHIKNNKIERRLYGIAVDCTASGGRNLKEAIKSFNETIVEQYKEKFEKITEAAVLFRVDSVQDIDKDFESNKMKIYRFFDLTEEIKKEMYEIQISKKTPILYNDRSHIKHINELKSSMLKEGLMKNRVVNS
jgi:hypothetical protein